MSVKIESGNLVFEYDLSKGIFGIRDVESGQEIIEGATASARLGNRGGSLSTSDAISRLESTINGTLYITHNFKNRPCTLEFSVEPLEAEPGFILAVSVDNGGAADIVDVDFFPLEADRVEGGSLFGGGAGHDFRFLRAGLLTWSGGDVYSSTQKMGRNLHRFIFDACHNPTVKLPKEPGHFIGEVYSAIHDAALGGTLVAGFITTADQMSQIDFKSGDGRFHHLRAVCHAEGMPLKKGGTLASEKLLLITPSCCVSCDDDSQSDGPLYATHDRPLREYARLAAEPNQVPKSKIFPHPPVGWCSWYYYYNHMTQKVILENLEAAQSLKDRLPIELFQIDDGYEPAPGDWLECNKKFPNGLKWMNQKIREAGMQPGLWLAPFFATNRSKLFREHPDWFIHRNGKPRLTTLWPNSDTFGVTFPLDTTHPGALRWLRETFDTIVNDWDYKYLKLDFLYNASLDGERYDPSATRAQAFRRGMETIREAAGPDTYILGCGTPLAMSLGLVNGSRVSGDTGPYWHSYFLAAILGHPGAPGAFDPAFANFTRYFMNGAWGYSDPDCLMCRFEDTKLTRDEVLSHAAIVALSGGPLFISDNLAKLKADSIKLAQQLIPPLDEAAVPVDLFHNSPPAVLVKKFRKPFDNSDVVGLFNWENGDRDLKLNFSEIGLSKDTQFHVFEIWTEKYLGVHTGGITLRKIPKHASRILSIRPVSDKPQVVATTFHFTQGGVDLAAQKFQPRKKMLRFRIDARAKRDGSVFIYCPPGFSPKSCKAFDDTPTRMSQVSDTLFRISLSMKDSVEIGVQF